jgi:4,5-dihydroxyphthalate decarboxylase
MDRRDVLKVLGTAAATQIVPSGAVGAGSSGARIINCAGYDYDRVRAIMDGAVGIENTDVHFDVGDIYSVTASAFGPEPEYGVTEIGLLPFIQRYINEGFRAYTLIPIFISRIFRHRNIFVHADSGIENPEDLRGRIVGTPGYGFSANTWIRGFLRDQHGVEADEMRWIETTNSSDGSKPNPNLNRHFLPDDFPLEKGPSGVDESQLLISGDCDALITAITPKAYLEGNPKIRRLFHDVRAAEQDYYKATGLFPIMHAVAVRTDLVEADPQLPKAVFDMYSRAKQIAYAKLETTTSLGVTLPWVTQEFEFTRDLMGKNYWSYGISDNRNELELALRYAHEQGLTKRHLNFEELFHPSTLELEETGI